MSDARPFDPTRAPDGPAPQDGPHPGSERESAAALDDDATLLLLALAARRRAGPFAPLLRRIEEPDGGRWFLDTVGQVCAAAGVGVALLSHPADGPGALRRVKSWAKHRLASSMEESAPALGEWPADEETLRALVAYAVTVATGLTAHDIRLSSRPPREWDPLFVDLSGLAPMPWAETFRRAAGR